MSVRNKTNQLSKKDFSFICQFVYDHTGIVLNDSKREMVYRRLTRIIRDRKLSSFTAYCDLLKSQPKEEMDYFVNAITTNLTSFFREQHHFDYMTQHELPRLVNNAVKGNKRLRIWSSASSTGEEPYSIAMTLLEYFTPAELSQWDAKILATDIDSNVLQKGKFGVYDERTIDEVKSRFKAKYFHRGVGQNANKVKIDKNLQSIITFKQLNLLHEWPMTGPFDIIFCRNVIIYFDKSTQLDLFERYHRLLTPGGLLILGHSENLGTYQQYFDNVGRTIFRKAF